MEGGGRVTEERAQRRAVNAFSSSFLRDCNRINRQLANLVNSCPPLLHGGKEGLIGQAMGYLSMATGAIGGD